MYGWRGVVGRRRGASRDDDDDGVGFDGEVSEMECGRDRGGEREFGRRKRRRRSRGRSSAAGCAVCTYTLRSPRAPTPFVTAARASTPAAIDFEGNWYRALRTAGPGSSSPPRFALKPPRPTAGRKPHRRASGGRRASSVMYIAHTVYTTSDDDDDDDDE